MTPIKPLAGDGREAVGLDLGRRACTATSSAVERLERPRLERAIGVIYRPESELASHRFEARLARQLDEYVWIDGTRASTQRSTVTLEGLPDTCPFGL